MEDPISFFGVIGLLFIGLAVAFNGVDRSVQAKRRSRNWLVHLIADLQIIGMVVASIVLVGVVLWGVTK